MAYDNQKDRSLITYIIEGDPIPLARCKVSFTNKRVFDSQKTLKLVTELTLKNQHGSRKLYQGPLEIIAYLYFHIPKTHKDTQPGDYHLVKPDADNCVKMLLDIANRVLFKDDCQVCDIICHKRYSDRPRTEFTIRELNGKN